MKPKNVWQELLQLPDPLSWLASEGMVFYASDAAVGDLVTGQTSIAATTPTFLLDIPEGRTCIPISMRLFQAGTVAGGAITYLMEFDNAKRYSSGGTSETILSSKTNTPMGSGVGTFYSNATAADAYGVRVDGALLGPDVSPAEGAVNQLIWTPVGGLDLLVGPATWAVHTAATGAGPTWNWSFKWAMMPTEWVS